MFVTIFKLPLVYNC